MDRKSAANIALIVSLAVFGIWQTLQRMELEAQLAALQSSHDRWSQDYQDQIGKLDKTIRQLRDKDTQLVQSTTSSSADNQSKVGGAPKPTPASSIQPDLRDSPEYRLALAKQTVALKYGGFLAGLKLSPDIQEQIKDRLAQAIAKSMTHGRDLSKKVASGEFTSTEAMADMKASAKNIPLTDIMSDYLNQDQLNAFTAFDSNTLERNKDSLSNMAYTHLQTEAPDLTEASRVLVATAFADEVYNPAKNQGASGMSALLAGYEHLETSLQDYMSEDQLRIATEWLHKREDIQREVIQNTKSL